MFAPVPAAQAKAVLDAAYDRGIRWFDTAPMYGYGTAERRVGQFLDNLGGVDGLTLSTKAGRVMRPWRWPGTPTQDEDLLWLSRGPFAQVFDYSYDGLLRSVEASLQRLGVEVLDAVFIHDIGRDVHGDRNDEFLAELRSGGYRALAELKAAGVVGAVGVGVNEVEALRTCLDDADLDCCLLANQFTLLNQPPSEDLFADCRRRGVRLVAGGVYNSGVLAGGDHFVYRDAPADIRQRVAALASACTAVGVPLKAAAIQFVTGSPYFACVLLGARSVEELDESLELMRAPLPDDLWDELVRRRLVDERWLASRRSEGVAP